MPNIERLKREAKKLRKQTGISHFQALDMLAQEQGYQNYRALMNSRGDGYGRQDGASTAGESTGGIPRSD